MEVEYDVFMCGLSKTDGLFHAKGWAVDRRPAGCGGGIELADVNDANDARRDVMDQLPAKDTMTDL